jgi:hypothetical protein
MRRNKLVLGSSVLALLIAAGAALALSGSSARAAPRAQFSNYIDDLPIMPGLSESDQGYTFDLSEGGRLAEARLSGRADPGAVRDFYAATLLQLGWKPTAADPHSYRRGPERLIFLVEPKTPVKGQAALEVMFVVTPDGGAASTGG